MGETKKEVLGMKKRFSKITISILALVLMLGLAGCKDKKDTTEVASDSDAVATQEDAEATTEATTATTTEAEEIEVTIEVDKDKLEMEIGDKEAVVATVTPDDLEDYKLLWSSSNTGVATVVDGEIEAVAAGSCVITVKVSGEPDKAQINVTVLPNETESGDMGNTDNDTTDSGSGNNSGSGSGSNSGGSATTEATTEAAATTEATTEAQQEAYYLEYANAVLELVNDVRGDAGVPPLVLDGTITAAAKIRAKECATSFSHTRPDGSSCFTALDEAGASYGACGENIAAGYWSPESVVQGWVNSPGHYSNMINASYTRMGLGCWYDSESDYGMYWAQMFAN